MVQTNVCLNIRFNKNKFGFKYITSIYTRDVQHDTINEEKKTDRDGIEWTTKVTKFEPNHVITLTTGDYQIETSFILLSANELEIKFTVTGANVTCTRKFTRK